jgi:hypothetical protein
LWKSLKKEEGKGQASFFPQAGKKENIRIFLLFSLFSAGFFTGFALLCKIN